MIQKINEIFDVWRFVGQVSETDFSFLNSNKLLCLYKDGAKMELLTKKSEVAEKWRNGYIINENLFYAEGKLELILKDNIFKILIINEEELFVKHIDYEKEEIRYGIFSFFQRRLSGLLALVAHNHAC